VLTVTELLRAHGVVGKFVEFFGPGLSEMPVANRATLANMAPEYGATVGFFPVDALTLDYMRLSGRSEELIATVEQYYRMQGMWRDDSRDITYSSTLELDMSTVVPSLAGPKRPQDRIALTDMKQQWHVDLDGQLRPDGGEPGRAADVMFDGERFDLADGDVVIAAITSCTNTSNPEVMVGLALLLARHGRRA
jgi:aconitate hydratase